MSKTIKEQYKSLSKAEKRKNNKRFLKYIMQDKWSLLLIFVATTLAILQGAAIPKLTQMIIDDYLPKNSTQLISGQAQLAIIWIIAIMLGFLVVKAIAIFTSTYIVRKFQQNLEMRLKEELFAKIQKLNVSYFDKVNEGFFMSRMSRDTTMAAEYARFIPENIINVAFSFSINFVFIFMYSWIIGCSSMGLLVIIVAYTYLRRKKFTKVWSDVKAKGDDYNQFIVNSFAGAKETKAYNQEDNQIKKYRGVADKYKKAWRKNFLLYGEWMTINTALLMMLPISVIAIGSWQVLQGHISVGVLTALVMYTGQIINPVNKFMAIFDLVMRGVVSLSRIFEVLDSPQELYKGENIKISKGGIVFKNVSLKYDNSDQHALNNLSFEIKHGEKVAFVGKTGSGKSTILKAIMKFYPIDKGSIMIDDQDISNVSVTKLRKGITLMSQEPYIFFDSVKSNIVFGSDEVSPEDYQDALETSQSSDFVVDLPQKDETNIGPRGVSLSGGQKQRIALARAIVKKSKIVLFDEATSALDNKTEQLIKKEIQNLTKNSTVIYVAHRLTTIQSVDRIFVINKGKIVEVGHHEELMKKKKHYYDLVKSSTF